MNEEKQVITKLHPNPEEYLEAETAFLRAVGLCITQWAFVDRLLFRLFRKGVGAPTEKAALLYYETRSITQRLKQVDLLLKNLLTLGTHAELSKIWQDLREKINELLPTRNIIAHQPVRRLGTSKGGKTVYIYGFHIEPYQRFLNKQFKGMKGKDALETDDLIDHSESVMELEVQMTMFVKKVVRTFRG
jgi:hypothetical protein